MSRRVLISGAGGMLGQDVARAARRAGFEVTACARADLDITDAVAVEAALGEHRPDAVINCAAWTDVDGAEANPEGAHAVNGTGAGNVAAAACSAGAWTIHVSSDYVFDGGKRAPYLESDPTGPVSAYGSSKLAGEHAVAGAAPVAHTIVRSSWLFGAGGPCFPATILRLAAERDRLQVVDDQFGCPTFTGHLATALIELARAPRPGILHVAGGGSCSWFEFAQRIVEESGASTPVQPVPTTQMPRPAQRPAYSVLASERDDAPELPPWQQGLAEYLALRVAAA